MNRDTDAPYKPSFQDFHPKLDFAGEIFSSVAAVVLRTQILESGSVKVLQTGRPDR